MIAMVSSKESPKAGVNVYAYFVSIFVSVYSCAYRLCIHVHTYGTQQKKPERQCKCMHFICIFVLACVCAYLYAFCMYICT